ncbi:MAG: hypothetical protein HQL24_07500 [Candidatus Omnitrophica bacterium]|nr:hypothetical protein [Candidatus Omnitrophota bacterium]
MFDLIRKNKAHLGDHNFMILWFEALLFSVLFGAAFHSWVVFGSMFLGLSFLLSRIRGMIYMAYVMSILWGFIAFSIAYSISWGLAMAAGGSFFLIGIKAHFAGLKKRVTYKRVLVKQSYIEWRRNGYQGWQNLN